MSNKAIMEFGKMLTKSENIFTAGAGGPIFAWAAPGDIVICGKAPEDFDGRVCSVKFPDEEKPLLCRLYRDGENVRVGFMDDYDIWKSYPADAVTIRYEVLAVVHQYRPMERPKVETAWEERVQQAIGEALGKFRFEDCARLIQHHRSGHTHETLTAAFSLGYQAGRGGGCEMNEKHLREAIVQRIEIANVKELNTIWHFVQAYIDPTGRREAERV